VADWATISALATAGGTLVLAGATFAAVRSSNRSARLAEEALLAGLRPLLVSSRREDPAQKIYFADRQYVVAPGGQAGVQATDQAVYLGISLRNAGSGIAVLDGWTILTGEIRNLDHRPPEDFTRLTRDLFIAPNDLGFWQGSFRDPSSEGYRSARAAVEATQSMGVDILYGNFEGGDRMISRFMLTPKQTEDGVSWYASVGRHWNVDRPDPREREP
jgi:hypothetical protein